MVYREEVLSIKQEAIDRVNEEVQVKKERNKKLLGIFMLLLMDYYNEHSKDWVLSVNRFERQRLLNDVKEKIIAEVEPQRSTDFLHGKNTLFDVVDKSYGALQRVIGVPNTHELNEEEINALLLMNYEEKNLEERIINNNKKLAGGLYVEFKKILSNGFTLGIASNMLREVFKKHEYENYRLLMNEQGRIFDHVQRKVFTEENNVREIMWVSALCQNTCPYCEMMDGSIFNVTDLDIPEIPAHVLCQCCWIPV